MHKLNNQGNRERTFGLIEDDLNGTLSDIFFLPEKENFILTGKEAEIRLFTILEKLT